MLPRDHCAHCDVNRARAARAQRFSSIAIQLALAGWLIAVVVIITLALERN